MINLWYNLERLPSVTFYVSPRPPFTKFLSVSLDFPLLYNPFPSIPSNNTAVEEIFVHKITAR